MQSEDQTDSLDDVLVSAEAAQDWARMPGWTAEEAAALITGFDPSRAHRADRKGPKYPSFKSTRRLFRRLVEMDKVYRLTSPLDWLTLCKSNDIAIDNQISSAVSNTRRVKNYRRMYIKARKNRIDEADLPPPEKRRQSYAKVICALVQKKYPEWPKANITKKLEGEVERVGLLTDLKVVREILREASEYLPGGERYPDRSGFGKSQ